jgi:hypothetical protein
VNRDPFAALGRAGPLGPRRPATVDGLARGDALGVRADLELTARALSNALIFHAVVSVALESATAGDRVGAGACANSGALAAWIRAVSPGVFGPAAIDGITQAGLRGFAGSAGAEPREVTALDRTGEPIDGSVAHDAVDAGVIRARVLVVDGQRLALAELLREVAHGADVAVGARVVVVARHALDKRDLDASGLAVAAPCPARALVVLSVTGVHLACRHALAISITAVEGADVLIEVARHAGRHGDHDRALSGRRVAAEL